jgi:hypothetical protein
MANRFFKNGANFRRDQNVIYEEIKSRLNFGNACYHSFHNFCLAPKNVKIIIYKTVISPVVLYGFETWSLTSREEYGLRVFESRVLRSIFRLKRDEVIGGCRKLHNE